MNAIRTTIWLDTRIQAYSFKEKVGVGDIIVLFVLFLLTIISRVLER